MGQRGPRARPTMRKPTANERPNSRTRAKLAPFQEGSAQYWDLLIDDRPFWSDPFDPERKRVWVALEKSLRARWPHSFSHGRRPSAWWAFTLPRLLDSALRSGRLTEEKFKTMTDLEIVHALDADEKERADIEDIWARHGKRA